MVFKIYIYYKIINHYNCKLNIKMYNINILRLKIIYNFKLIYKHMMRL